MSVLSVTLLVWVMPLNAQETQAVEEWMEEGVWLDHNAGLRDRQLRTIAVDWEEPSRLYAGARGYLYRSLDFGEQWEVVHRLFGADRAWQEEERSSFGVDDIDSLTDEQIDAVDERFRQLEGELFEELLRDGLDEDTAEEIVDAESDQLLEDALDEVLSESPRTEREHGYSITETEDIASDEFLLIAVDPSLSSRIFAASGRGLFRSDDYGTSFSVAFRGVGEDERRVLGIAFGGDTIVLATGSGIHLSDDDGESWDTATGVGSNDLIRFVAASPSDPTNMYAIVHDRIYRSTDSGRSWTPEANPIGLDASDLNHISVDPTDPSRVWLATVEGVLLSSDAAHSFLRVGGTGLRERNILWLTPLTEVVLAATADGVYFRRYDSTSWHELSAGLEASVINQTEVTPSGHVWLASDGGAFRLLARDELAEVDTAARDAVAYWAEEPNLGETVMAALVYAGYAELPSDAWARRIFWSRFLPRARVRYTVLDTDDWTEDFVPGVDNLAVLTDRDQRIEDDTEFQIMALWDIGAVIFDDREIRARDVADGILRERNELIRRVIRLFDSRRDLVLQVTSNTAATTARRVMELIELEELTARLDLLTGRYFSVYPDENAE